MKNSLALGLLSAVTVLLSLPIQPAESIPSKNQSFEQWCLQKDALPTETKHTVDVLLKQAGTQDCKLADSNLNSLSVLKLSDRRISDIRPLSSLINLTELRLGDNEISDIRPLSNLTNLTWLYLDDNKISDIKPIPSLTNLTTLKLFNNQIVDIRPIASLTNLTALSL